MTERKFPVIVMLKNANRLVNEVLVTQIYFFLIFKIFCKFYALHMIVTNNEQRSSQVNF